jgi:hypothetical protein
MHRQRRLTSFLVVFVPAGCARRLHLKPEPQYTPYSLVNNGDMRAAAARGARSM